MPKEFFEYEFFIFLNTLKHFEHFAKNPQACCCKKKSIKKFANIFHYIGSVVLKSGRAHFEDVSCEENTLQF